MNLPLMVLLASVASSTGGDLEDELSRKDEHAQTKALRTYARSHAELSFGYLGQWADETNRAMELKPSADNSPVAGTIASPFLGAPFSRMVLAGPTFETRAVVEQVRMTLGFRFPFTNFRPSDTAQTVTLADGSHDVLVRSAFLWDLRTGLGFELPFRRVTPFVDMLGDVQTLTTQLTIDGAPSTYVSRAFSLGGRIGARYQVNHLFLMAAVEATALGPLRVGGTFQVGLAI